MDDKLKLLIEHYAGEVATLQKLINEELDIEGNYLSASWYQWGLSFAQNEYSKLNNFNEPFYSDKERILKKIDWIKKKLAESKEGDENYHTFALVLQFAEEEYKTVCLKNLPQVDHLQSHLFDQAVNKVFNREIKGVILVINQKTGLRFEILRKRQQVIATIPFFANRRQTIWFDEYELKRLTKFGFEVKKQPSRLVKSFSLKPEGEADRLKIFLARCYFEILSTIPVQRQGYIEYVY